MVKLAEFHQCQLCVKYKLINIGNIIFFSCREMSSLKPKFMYMFIIKGYIEAEDCQDFLCLLISHVKNYVSY